MDDKTEKDGKQEENPFAGFISEGFEGGELAQESAKAAEEGDGAEKKSKAADEATSKDEEGETDGKDAAADNQGGDEGSGADKEKAVASDEEDEEGEEDGEGEDEEKSPQAKKGPKETFQQRINELTKARREAERHAEALERRLGEIEVKLRQDLTAQQDEGKQEEDLPPEAEDFEYGEIDPNYIKALVDFETKQVLAVAKEEFKQERQAEAAAQEAQELRHKWDAQVERGAENFDDFHEKVVTGAEKGEWSLTPDMAELVIESPVGAEIAYYLATHSQESAQVAVQSPLRQAAYFGRLEARFSSPADAPKAKKAKKATKAPPPVAHARGAGGKFQPSASTDDFAVFEAMANGAK